MHIWGSMKVPGWQKKQKDLTSRLSWASADFIFLLGSPEGVKSFCIPLLCWQVRGFFVTISFHFLFSKFWVFLNQALGWDEHSCVIKWAPFCLEPKPHSLLRFYPRCSFLIAFCIQLCSHPLPGDDWPPNHYSAVTTAAGTSKSPKVIS